MRDTNLQCFTIFNSLFNSLLCCHSPTATVALWGDSISRVDSGGVSMGLSRSSGAWPSPRDHTGQLGKTHTWHSALHCHCARKNTAIQLRNPEIHPPFTFHLKVLVSPEESYTDRRTHFFSLSVITLHTAAEFKLFATWKAWNRQYENTETASISTNLRDIFCTRVTKKHVVFVQSSFSWCSSLLCLHILCRPKFMIDKIVYEMLPANKKIFQKPHYVWHSARWTVQVGAMTFLFHVA